MAATPAASTDVKPPGPWPTISVMVRPLQKSAMVSVHACDISARLAMLDPIRSNAATVCQAHRNADDAALD
jgi:hypothetical protein